MSWFIDNLAHLIEVAVIWVINQLIASVGALISTVVALLPNMTTWPSWSLPTGVQTWFDFGAYWFPFSYLLVVIGIVFTLWLAWMVIAIPLRWAKAVPGDE